MKCFRKLQEESVSDHYSEDFDTAYYRLKDCLTDIYKITASVLMLEQNPATLTSSDYHYAEVGQILLDWKVNQHFGLAQNCSVYALDSRDFEDTKKEALYEKDRIAKSLHILKKSGDIKFKREVTNWLIEKESWVNTLLLHLKERTNRKDS